MSPAERDRLVAQAAEVLHKSCPTASPRMEAGPARAIAVGYLQLALLPSAVWDHPTEVPGATVGLAWDEAAGVTP